MSTTSEVGIRIDPERCNDCGYCIHSCPHDVIGVTEETNTRGYRYAYAANPDQCTACGFCATVCPQIAIEGIPR